MATSETKTTSTTSTKKKAVTESAVKEVKTETAPKVSKREMELEAQISNLMNIVETLQHRLNATSSAQPTVVVTAPSTDVTLVYMSDSLGVIQTNTTTLNCTRFGEEFVLPRSEFDAIVGKYRHWFDEGILAISSNNVEIAAAKGIKTDKEYNISNDVLKKIGSMSVDEIEKLWAETTADSHKLSIVTYYKRKFIENIEQGYRDRARVDVMNRLTKGAFEREATELSGSNLKIRPTEL